MRLILSLAAVAALLFAPLSARADTPTKTVTYRTSYHLIHPSTAAGEYTGRLTLRFYAGGLVNGTYRDEFEGGFHPVSGGVTSGNKLWLSFGHRGAHQFNGTIGKDGSITGTLSNWRGPNVYQFTAAPAS